MATYRIERIVTTREYFWFEASSEDDAILLVESDSVVPVTSDIIETQIDKIEETE